LNGLFGQTFDWKSAAFGGLFTLAAQWMDFPGGLFPGLVPTTPTTRSTTTKVSSEKVAAEKAAEKATEKIPEKSNATTILTRRRRSVTVEVKANTINCLL